MEMRSASPHNIGKGYPGADHSETGAVMAEKIANRMGLSYGDAAMA
jgi:[protein-PII] uridylyltransferase